ncbi:MAG: DEAD/DEAH box helicase [Alphaproteobacteria bacterium]|nr:DEAD/DEAH box helicase [Alphaproteobacteria bacterium]
MSLSDSIHPALAQALQNRGYAALTAVQEAVVAEGLGDADLIVSAQTGSGKTVAFGLAMASTVLGEGAAAAVAGDPLALVIAPTRELALQVERELAWLYASAGARVASCVGGMDARQERRALERGVDIVVGTPGRLADHIRRGALSLAGMRVVVLDEADEMLNLGFREELEFILGAAPAERRTLMFSATMAKGVEALARTFMSQAVRLNTVSRESQHVDIAYRALVTAGPDVDNAIFNVLRYYDAANAIVFCGTREGVNRMTSRLSNRGFAVATLSGELSQKERTHALQAMRDGRARVCVATDVAARGLDLPDLELVIHADLPKNTEGLLHRSGRTGRAGRKGTSVLIVPVKARRRIERLLVEAKVRAEWADPPSADDVKKRDDERLLADPTLAEPGADVDQALLAKLMAAHDAETIAAAFIRLARKGVAAPEDLDPVMFDPAGGERPARREASVGGAWVQLSVGRAQSAEPRWLIPMLCKAGGFSKRDLGSIRINERDSMVEMSPTAAASLLSNAGPDGKLEKGVFVRWVEGPGPDVGARPPQTRGRPRPATRGAAVREQAPPEARTRGGRGKKGTDKKPKWDPLA